MEVIDLVQIDTILGSETFQHSSAKVHIFCMPIVPEEKEEIIFQAVKSPAKYKVREQVHIQYRDAIKTYTPGVDAGKWALSSYMVETGAILKLMISINRKGAVPLSCCKFLYVRKTAAHNSIEIPLTGDKYANITKSVISGKFDLITLEEANNFGVVINDRFKHLFNDDVFKLVSTVIEKEAALERKPVLISKVYKVGDEEVRVSKFQCEDGMALNFDD